MATAMAMRRAGRAGVLMRGAEWGSNYGPSGARCMASAAARVEDDRSWVSGRALGAFSALLGAGALYNSFQRAVLLLAFLLTRG